MGRNIENSPEGSAPTKSTTSTILGANSEKNGNHPQSKEVDATFDPAASAVEEMARAEDHAASRLGLRSIATFEAVKGILVLFVGLGLSSYLHHDAAHAIESITRHFHLNPAHHVPAIFIAALTSVSNINLWVLAAGALAYSLVRFIEAFGLWHQKVWAEWFAIASGGVYLPIEIYEMIVKFTLLKAGITFFNTLIVAYLVWQRLRQERAAEVVRSEVLKSHANQTNGNPS